MVTRIDVQRKLSENTSINRQVTCGGIKSLLKMISKHYGEGSALGGYNTDAIYISNPINCEEVLLKNAPIASKVCAIETMNCDCPSEPVDMSRVKAPFELSQIGQVFEELYSTPLEMIIR